MYSTDAECKAPIANYRIPLKVQRVIESVRYDCKFMSLREVLTPGESTRVIRIKEWLPKLVFNQPSSPLSQSYEEEREVLNKPTNNSY